MQANRSAIIPLITGFLLTIFLFFLIGNVKSVFAQCSGSGSYYHFSAAYCRMPPDGTSKPWCDSLFSVETSSCTGSSCTRISNWQEKTCDIIDLGGGKWTCNVVDGSGQTYTSAGCSSGGPPPTQPPPPSPTPFHLGCGGKDCVRVAGAGSNDCGAVQTDAPACTHKACFSQQCTLVAGGGANACNQDCDCPGNPGHPCGGPPPCQNPGQSCGPGNNCCAVGTCSGGICGGGPPPPPGLPPPPPPPPMSRHTICDSCLCRSVLGEGENECPVAGNACIPGAPDSSSGCIGALCFGLSANISSSPKTGPVGFQPSATVSFGDSLPFQLQFDSCTITWSTDPFSQQAVSCSGDNYTAPTGLYPNAGTKYGITATITRRFGGSVSSTTYVSTDCAPVPTATPTPTPVCPPPIPADTNISQGISVSLVVSPPKNGPAGSFRPTVTVSFTGMQPGDPANCTIFWTFPTNNNSIPCSGGTFQAPPGLYNTPGTAYQIMAGAIENNGWQGWYGTYVRTDCAGVTPTPTTSTVTPTPTPTGPVSWKKLKDTSFAGVSSLNNPVPKTALPYDSSDPGNPYFIDTSNGSDPGDVAAQTIDTGKSDVSSKNWSTQGISFTPQFSVSSFISYVKARKTYTDITTQGLKKGITADNSIYYIEGNQTISDNGTINQNKIVVIVNGDLTITDSKFNPSPKSVAILVTGKLILDPAVTELDGIFIVQGLIDTGTAARGLKVVGNLISQNSLVNKRSQSNNNKPSVFIVVDPKYYLDLLPYLSIRTYDWSQQY